MQQSTPRVDFCIALDVNNVETTSRFYERVAGFQTWHVIREGQIFQERHLYSPRYPGLGLVLREAFGKRSIGSQPGTILRLAIRVQDLKAVVAALHDVQWQGPAPDPANLGDKVRMVDPDGYVLEFYQNEPGTGF